MHLIIPATFLWKGTLRLFWVSLAKSHVTLLCIVLPRAANIQGHQRLA